MIAAQQEKVFRVLDLRQHVVRRVGQVEGSAVAVVGGAHGRRTL